MDLNLGLVTVGLFDLLAFLGEVELLLEARVRDLEILEEALAPDDVAGGINDEGLRSVEGGDVEDVLHHLGDDLTGVVGDEGDGKAEDLLGDGITASTIGDLGEELLNLFLFGIVGDGNELDFLVLLGKDGEFLVDDETTLVEGVEEEGDSDDTVGLEFVLVATDEVEGRDGGEGLAEEDFVLISLAVRDRKSVV